MVTLLHSCVKVRDTTELPLGVVSGRPRYWYIRWSLHPQNGRRGLGDGGFWSIDFNGVLISFVTEKYNVKS